MRVLFVLLVPPPGSHDVPHFAQGPGYLSAVLKSRGHSCDLVQVGRPNEKKLRRKVDEFCPDMVGISTTSGYFHLVGGIVQTIISTKDLPIFIGGVHPTVEPEESISVPGVTGICRGEGELAFADLIDGVNAGRDYRDIPNFWFKSDGGVIKNPIGPFIEDLDTLPFPDREIFDYARLLRVKPTVEVMCSRGCPYKCSYCVNARLEDIYRGQSKFVRFRSVDNVLEEIDEVLERYDPVNFVEFHDDIFTLNKRWLREFCEKYPRRFRIPFTCNTHVKVVDDEIADLLKDANCVEIKMGIESGSERIRNEVLGRRYTNAEVLKAFEVFKKRGIRTWAFNMLGVPSETEETIQESIRLHKGVGPDFVQVSMFYPYPGTRAYDLCRSENLISDRTTDSYLDSVSILDLPTISHQKLAYYHRVFRWEVMYPRIAPLIRVLCRIPLGRTRVLYDLLLPLIKGVYRFKKYKLKH